MKVRIKAREMHDAEATHVSLVPRGANMIPFRIIKDEDGKEGYPMIDFHKVFKIKQPEPGVLAIVVPKETDAGTARIHAAGFSTEFKQEIDDCVAYLQQDDIELGQDDQVIVKFDDGLSAVIRLKSFEPYGDSTDFTENLEKNGFLPGFDMALTVLRDTVFNALFEAENPSDAAGTIDTAVKGFRSHVANMTAALPESAFKLDPSVATSKSADEELRETTLKGVREFNVTINIGPETSVGAPSISNVDETQTEGGEEIATSPAVSGSSSSLRKEDESDEATDDSDGEATEAVEKTSQDGEGEVETVSADPESDTSEIQKQIDKLVAGLESISTTLKESVEGITAKVGTLSERVGKTEENINGTTKVSSPEDPEAEARKSNGVDTDPPLMDTGWDRLQAQ